MYEVDLLQILFGPRRRRRALRASQAVAVSLAPWCAANDFAVLEPLHPDVIDRWSEALFLLDLDKDREVGTALHRRHARGDLYLFDSFATSGLVGPRAAIAVVTTTASPRMIEANDVLGGMPRGSSFARTPRSLVVCHPGPLTLPVADGLRRRLTRLEAALTQAPGTTRL